MRISTVALAVLTLLTCVLIFPLRGEIRTLEEDAFSTEDKAAEAEAIINQNFSDLFNNKANISEDSLGEPRFSISDVLNPELSELNAFFIMENADDLWRDKEESGGGSPGTRSYFLNDLGDPEAINIINRIFEELDAAKAEQ